MLLKAKQDIIADSKKILCNDVPDTIRKILRTSVYILCQQKCVEKKVCTS